MKLFIALALAVVWFIPLTCFSKIPSRIISLDLCTDWMLGRLASSSQILALSPMIKQYPVNWVSEKIPFHNGTLEQIISLNPDLIIGGEYNASMLRKRLKSLGYAVKTMSLPRSLEDIYQYENEFKKILGKSKQDHQLKLKKLKSQHLQDQPTLLLLGANGIGTGQGTFENEVIEFSGWRNYLHNSGYVALDLEKLVIKPPDAILWSAPFSNALANQFANHPVLKNILSKNKWLKLDYWYWECPGPWTLGLVDQLKKLIHD